MTLIHSALAGGDSIDDADALRAGSTEAVLGHELRAPSTLGTFLRSFSWGHARQLDVVSGQLLSRAWQAGAGPGTEPLTIDVDSSICETYGLNKQGGSKFTYNHVRGYHPLRRYRRKGCYGAPRIIRGPDAAVCVGWSGEGLAGLRSA
jgi:hypothetical protein